MKLSDKERQVMLALQANGAASTSDLAKQCGLSQSSIRYCVQSLVSKSFVETLFAIDEARLGLRHINLLLAIESGPRCSSEAIAKILISSPSVVWCLRIAGEYTHYLSLFVPSIDEVTTFLDLFVERAGPIITRTLMAEGTGYEFYGSKWLHPTNARSTLFRTGFPSLAAELDQLDVEIIAELVSHPLAPISSVARALGRQLSSIDYRVKRLRDLGVIRAPFFRINVSELDQVQHKVLIWAKYPSSANYKKLCAFCEQHLNVLELFRCFGSWHFEVLIEADSAASANRALADLTSQNSGNIDRILVLPCLTEIKTKFDVRRALIVKNPKIK